MRELRADRLESSAAPDMSKLPPSLKALINAPFARPGQVPAPPHIRDVYTRIAREARERRYGERPWLTLSVCRCPDQTNSSLTLTGWKKIKKKNKK